MVWLGANLAQVRAIRRRFYRRYYYARLLLAGGNMRGPTRDLPTFIIAPAICCSNKQVVGALNPRGDIYLYLRNIARPRLS